MTAKFSDPEIRKARVGWWFRFRRSGRGWYADCYGWRPTSERAASALDRKFRRRAARLERTVDAWDEPEFTE